MVEANPRITARRFTAGLPRLLGIPLHLGTDLVAIHGTRRVEGVTLRRADGTESTLETDGVIVTGGFTPDATLDRLGPRALHPASGVPVIDHFGRFPDPAFFATANLSRPVEAAGGCWHV